MCSSMTIEARLSRLFDASFSKRGGIISGGPLSGVLDIIEDRSGPSSTSGSTTGSRGNPLAKKQRHRDSVKPTSSSVDSEAIAKVNKRKREAENSEIQRMLSEMTSDIGIVSPDLPHGQDSDSSGLSDDDDFIIDNPVPEAYTNSETMQTSGKKSPVKITLDNAAADAIIDTTVNGAFMDTIVDDTVMDTTGDVAFMDITVHNAGLSTKYSVNQDKSPEKKLSLSLAPSSVDISPKRPIPIWPHPSPEAISETNHHFADVSDIPRSGFKGNRDGNDQRYRNRTDRISDRSNSRRDVGGGRHHDDDRRRRASRSYSRERSFSRSRSRSNRRDRHREEDRNNHHCRDKKDYRDRERNDRGLRNPPTYNRHDHNARDDGTASNHEHHDDYSRDDSLRNEHDRSDRQDRMLDPKPICNFEATAVLLPKTRAPIPSDRGTHGTTMALPPRPLRTGDTAETGVSRIPNSSPSIPTPLSSGSLASPSLAGQISSPVTSVVGSHSAKQGYPAMQCEKWKQAVKLKRSADKLPREAALSEGWIKKQECYMSAGLKFLETAEANSCPHSCQTVVSSYFINILQTYANAGCNYFASIGYECAAAALYRALQFRLKDYVAQCSILAGSLDKLKASISSTEEQKPSEISVPVKLCDQLGQHFRHYKGLMEYLEIWAKAKALRPSPDVLAANKLKVLHSIDEMSFPQVVSHVRAALSSGFMR